MEAYLKNLDAGELEKSKQVIGQFITSCSHTMRGPLKSISGLVTLLQSRRDFPPNDAEMFLNLINATIDKMEHTLDELEHFLENSKREVKLQRIDCHELLKNLIHQFSEEIESKHLKIKIGVEQTIPLYSDLSRLRIILENIFSNAIQFRDVNKVDQEITISINVTSEVCKIFVLDNGIGIDPGNHSKIFQLFYRATERSEGTGVGLYVVKEAIEKMGGEISVDSMTGKGSNFMITLPNRLSNQYTKSKSVFLEQESQSNIE